MPRDSGMIGTPAEWLRRAKSNLAIARQVQSDEVLWEDLCFDAQQAAEKAFKAVLVSRSVDFPKTHNIRVLLNLLDSAQQDIPEDLRKAVGLTVYATMTRYPGEAEPVTENEYRKAVALATKIVEWAEEMVSR